MEEPQYPSFEDFRQDNGLPYWWSDDFATMLQYDDPAAFEKVIQKAIKACMSAGIDWPIEFRQVDEPGSVLRRWKLSRFACYMVAMSADSSKVNVAKAQVYFASMTQAQELRNAYDEVGRLEIRQDLVEGQKALTRTALEAGVEQIDRFQNAGFRGMYNMINVELARKRGVDKTEIYERMGRTELAANLFRVTLTEEKIKSEDVTGQANLEQTHFNVAREVRRMVQSNTGMAPEDLPQGQKLPQVKKALKSTRKQLEQKDKPRKGKE